jgi:GNAT superfamily N-acetyltransferase
MSDEHAISADIRYVVDDEGLAVEPFLILVDPAWQGQGVGRRLMELAWEASPTSLFFGAQPGKEGFFERLGYQRSLQSYARRKARSGAT